MQKIYNKLVRDNIPQIIKEDKRIAEYVVLSDEEYITELDKKLKEELAEYQVNKGIEDLADILEVIYAICEVRGVSEEKLMEIKNNKLIERGGFKNRILLKTVK